MNNYNKERYNPLDNPSQDTFIKLEHLGRYLFACDYLRKHSITENVLDIACGTGYGSYLLSKHIKNVVGIDKNTEEVADQYKKDNIVFIKEDIDKVDLTSTYQAIICFETLEHVNNPNKLLKQISQCLTNKGLFLLSIPNAKYEKLDENGNNLDIYHKTIFKLDDLLKQLNNDFKIIKVLGQSKINEIINKNPNLNLNIHSQEEVIEKAYNLAYPNKEKIEDTYSYIIICQKKEKIL